MSGRLLLLTLVATLGAAGVVGLVMLVLVAVRGAAPSPSQAAGAAVRHAGVVHAVALAALTGALVAGPAGVALLPLSPAQGRYLGLVPAAAGLAFAAVHALGELTWPRPTGTVRRAPLTRRTVRDVAPRWLRVLASAWAALGAAVLVACGLVATPEGRAISRTFEAGSATSGPFPGWYFGVPLVAALVVVLVAGEVVLRLVAGRPVVTGAGPEWDLGLRRLSAHRVLRGVQLVLAWTVAGVLVVAGGALRNVADSGVGTGTGLDALGATAPGHAAAGVAALVLGAVVALAGTAVALVPGRPAHADAGTAALDRATA